MTFTTDVLEVVRRSGHHVVVRRSGALFVAEVGWWRNVTVRDAVEHLADHGDASEAGGVPLPFAELHEQLVRDGLLEPLGRRDRRPAARHH